MMNEEHVDEDTAELMRRKIAEQEKRISALSQKTASLKRTSTFAVVLSFAALAVIVLFFVFIPLMTRIPAQAPSWYPVKTFSGTGDWSTSSPFGTGTNWRIRWSVELRMPVTENASFWFSMNREYAIYPTFELRTVTAGDIEAAPSNSLRGVEYIIGHSRQELTVMAEGVNWEIIIEEYS